MDKASHLTTFIAVPISLSPQYMQVMKAGLAKCILKSLCVPFNREMWFIHWSCTWSIRVICVQ